MANTSDPAALPPGTIVDGRYRLARRLGRGGFAWVYEGEHTDLGRAAAVKLLDPPRGRAAEQFAERFMREARIVARLNHPNVVTVYDFGVHRPTGQPYLAMELLNGHDLEHELTQHGPLEPSRAKELFLGAAEALRVAHEAGVVHKDLKPSNLFIADPNTPDERMVLLDFGIASAVDDESRITQVGGFTGTPAYVAPEYARHLAVSPAIDVYQLGLILSESLSGTPCVVGQSSVQMIIAHCSGEVDLPATVLESGFGVVVRTATEFEPERRYKNGAEFGAALAEVDPTTLEHAIGTVRPGDVMTAQLIYETVDDAGVASAPTTRISTAGLRAEQVDSDANPTLVRASEQMGWPWYLAGVGGVAVIAVVLALAAKTPAPAPVDAVSAPEPQPTAPEAAAEPEVVLAEPEAGAEEDEEELTLKPRFTVSTSPIGAVVFQGNDRLGRTPVVLRGERVDGTEVELRIELDGHKPRTETVALTDGGRLDVELESTRKALRPSTVPRSSPGDMLHVIEFSKKLNAQRAASGGEAAPSAGELLLTE